MRIFVSAKTINWAIEVTGQGEDVWQRIAKRLQKESKPEWVKIFKTKGQLLTLRQVEIIAKVLGIPPMFLTLPTPPSIDVSLPMFRKGKKPLSFYSKLTIGDAFEKSSWMAERRQYFEQSPTYIVGILKEEKEIDAVVQYIEEELGISYKDNISSMVKKLERFGVLVMRRRRFRNTRIKLSPEEFRGFAIADKWAPVIFINASDAYVAQRFTVVHELVHILLGKSGVSPYVDNILAEHEDMSNMVSENILVPISENKRLRNLRSLVDIVEYARKKYVSPGVVIHVLWHRGFITQSKAKRLFSQYKRQWIEGFQDDYTQRIEQKSSPKVRYIVRLRVENSYSLTNAVLLDVYSGRISEHDASRLIHLSPDKVSHYAKIAYEEMLSSV